MKVNLLEETELMLAQHNYTWHSVKFIANAEGLVEIASFITQAKAYNYSKEELAPNVDPTLVIVGGTWWLSRAIGINGEQWVFHKKPAKPTLQSVDFSISSRREKNKILII